jgi:hypothetical protein
MYFYLITLTTFLLDFGYYTCNIQKKTNNYHASGTGAVLHMEDFQSYIEFD